MEDWGSRECGLGLGSGLSEPEAGWASGRHPLEEGSTSPYLTL